jgi:hypothetical protein
MLAAISGFISSGILFLIALIFFALLPIMILIGDRNMVGILAMYSYYGLAFWFWANMLYPWIQKWMKKIPNIEYETVEWRLYIRELSSILRGYLQIWVYIFPMSMIYIFLEKSTWPLYLSSDIPIFLIILTYISLLIVPKEELSDSIFSIRI